MAPFTQNSKTQINHSDGWTPVSTWWWRGSWAEDSQGHKELLKVMGMFIILTGVLVSLICTRDKTHQITYFKHAVYYMSIYFNRIIRTKQTYLKCFSMEERVRTKPYAPPPQPSMLSASSELLQHLLLVPLVVTDPRFFTLCTVFTHTHTRTHYPVSPSLPFLNATQGLIQALPLLFFLS